jgi:isopentenyl-diphosphate Delta-isomerase
MRFPTEPPRKQRSALPRGPRTASEFVVLCAEDGTALGSAAKEAVHHRDTPLHLAFSCYVFDGAGQVLVTRRAHTKQTFAGVRTNSCCGHPAPGEALAVAVQRRLAFELDVVPQRIDLMLPDFRYRATARDGTVENELCPVYRAVVVTDHVRPNPVEVDDAWWADWTSFVADGVADDPLSAWALEQVGQLAELGPDPLLWPTAPDARLPRAATPDGLASAVAPPRAP